MLKRTISGSIYAILVAGFFLLRQFVDFRIFTILPWILSVIGTVEIAKVLKEKMDKSEFILSIFAGITVIPFYACFSYLLRFTQYALSLSLAYVLLIIVICIISVIIRNKKGYNGKGKDIDFRAFFYPVILLVFLTDMNSFLSGRAFIGLLLVFVIASMTDVFAYFVGVIYNKIKKDNAKKLFPKLSPKKTVAGGIGGLVGGILGAILVSLIFAKRVAFFKLSSPVLIFAIIGLGGAVFTQGGDLFASYIKRSIGVKDFGSIIPGHGGVMDRIDGLLFLTIFIHVIFTFI